MPKHYLSKMNREQLLEHTKLLEKKIDVYAERDWLVTQAYIAELKECDMLLLDMYDRDTLVKEFDNAKT